MATWLTKEALYKKSPQEITALLYEACYDNVNNALTFIATKDYIDANLHLQKAVDILERLGAGINYEAGVIADQLDALYNYMVDKLVEANYEKNADKLKEVLHILNEIMTAWSEAMKKDRPEPTVVKRQLNAYEKTSIYE